MVQSTDESVGELMPGFDKGIDRGQSMLFPAMLDDYVAEDNSVRAVDVFIESLDLAALGFNGAQPLKTGRPSYDPATKLGNAVTNPRMINRRPIGSRHTGQVEINHRRCKLGEVVLCFLAPMTVMRAYDLEPFLSAPLMRSDFGESIKPSTTEFEGDPIYAHTNGRILTFKYNPTPRRLSSAAW
jgi:hypothetical protein